MRGYLPAEIPRRKLLEMMDEQLPNYLYNKRQTMKNHNAPNGLLPFYLANQLQVDNRQSRYNLCFSYQLPDNSMVLLLIEKLQKLIQLQAYLRQTFTMEQQRLVSQIHDALPANIHFFDSTRVEFESLEKVLIKEQHTLDQGSLIQLNIIKLVDDDSYIALFNIHHILMDGHSLEQFIKDLNCLIAGKTVGNEDADTYFLRLKNELALREEVDCPEIKEYIQIVNAIAANMEYMEGKTSADILYYTEILPGSIKRKLVDASRTYNLSLFNLLLLAWSVFIAKLSQQKNIIIHYPVNIRNDKSIAGCFINTIAFPLIFSSDENYLTLIQYVKEKIPILKKVTKFDLRNTFSLNPISCFSYSNHAKPHDLIVNNIVLNSKAYPQIAHSNISIKYKEDDDSLFFSMDILSGLFPEYFSSNMLQRFFDFCEKLLNSQDQPISRVDLILPWEKQLTLSEFNQNVQNAAHDRTLVELFENQVQATPNKIALVFEDIKLSYDELNKKSNQLAHYLVNHYRIKPDDLIALFLERNEYTLIAIIAVLKTGGAYVPIDFNYPNERIEYILEDTQVNILLTNENHLERLVSIIDRSISKHYSALNKLDLVSIDSQEIQQEMVMLDDSNIITAGTSVNLAYVIYTSGTTGNPKGVMIEHKNVSNTLYALKQVYQKKNESLKVPLKITAFTSYVFDVSLSEFFVPLLQGDELHLLSEPLRRDILSLSKYLIDNQINYVYLPPVLLANLPRLKYPSLQGIIYAGEPCDSETAHYWSIKTQLYNYYGPTEASIYATGLQIRADEVHLIGKPIANTTAYVLDNDMNLQPIGLIGELYLGGQGLAKGYLNQRELTEERFISNPFQTAQERIQNTNSRLYKTGDLVRWCPDGNLEYLGRNDFQVKIRGYRIELGEIENALLGYPGIHQAVVLVKKLNTAGKDLTSHQILVGYYVSNEKIEEQKIQEYLSIHLPEYMQPSAFVHLVELPVSVSGKLDRHALPMPALTQSDDYIPPRNDKEALICAAFAKILALPQVSIEDDFFKLGGNSITAISLVTSLQANCDIKMMDVFNLKTPKKIANEVLFIKNKLKSHLKNIQFHHVQANAIPNQTAFQSKLDNYYQSIHCLKISCEKVPISNVLLTGATGFLGCNILKVLLTTTDYTIFLLIRADSDADAFTRVNQKFEYYFDENLNQVLNKRLFIYSGDLENRDLGLSDETYQMFITQIDSIIHSAALTKHYGEYDTFYSANVQATTYLLELSKLTKLKHFHYISTSSVLSEIHVPHGDYYVFTEDDDCDFSEDCSNIYVKTKLEGEKLVLKYRQHGIKGNIYRVGNLAFMASNQRAQENVEENGFFMRLYSLIHLKMVAPEVGAEEISPVDLTALAIVKLFDTHVLLNHIFHVFNPVIYNLSEILSQDDTLDVKMVSINQFIDTIIKELDNPEYNQLIELFLLHKRWLNEEYTSTSVCVLQDKTYAILKQLGFEWSTVTAEAIRSYLRREINRVKQTKHT